MKKEEVAGTEQNRIKALFRIFSSRLSPDNPLSETWQKQSRVQVTDFQVFQQGKCNSSDVSLMMEKGKHLFKRGFLGRTRWAGTKRWIPT